MATLVERHSRFAIVTKVRGKDTANVVSALSKQVRQLPLQLRRSLTWDRGKEMANHKNFTIATDVRVYLCDPRSAWQRGSNENTNGLLRQYFPKGMGSLGLLSGVLKPDRIALKPTPQENLGV
jgi:IS30 family transposase